MKLTKEARRLGIFFFYDQDGIADEYILFYLKSILPFLEKLLIVCNGRLSVSSRQQLENLANTTVLVRENKGFDVWAYKTGIEYCGFDHIGEYDELIMFNFTIMGPVCSLQPMFDTMNERDLDFWGLTIHNGAPFDPWGLIEGGCIPVHIQSHFIAVRKKMLSSFEFKEYWKNMPMIHRYEEAVGLHEAVFTRKFEEKGYVWDVYVDTKDLLHETFYPMFNMPVELIRDKNCPFFKRKLFLYDWNELISENGFHAAAELYRYIKDESEYDINLIDKHVLRTGNLNSFLDAVNSRYIIPDSSSSYHDEYKKEKVAFILSIEPDSHKYYQPYLPNILPKADCYLLVPEEFSEDVIPEISNCSSIKYIKREPLLAETQWIGLLQEIAQDYDYICNLQDISGDYLQVLTNIRSFAKLAFDCMAKSKDYIDEIINLFQKNENLGVLIPFTPVHSAYFGINGNEWGSEENYEATCSLLKNLGCDVPISYNVRPVVSLSGCAWFRTAALKPLIDCKDVKPLEKDLQKSREPVEPVPHFWKDLCRGIKYTWTYMAQKEGYSSGYVCPESAASNMLVNYNNTIAKINNDFHNVHSLYDFLLTQNADFIPIAINFDTGSGYSSKNMQSQVIIRKMYSLDNIFVKFTVTSDSKEILIRIADGFMCICKNIKLTFLDEKEHLVNIKYNISNTADICTKDGLEVFFGSAAEYRLRGHFNDASFLMISFEKLAVIPVIEGAEKILKKRW